VAEESLAEAFDRLGVQPLPTVEELQAMSEAERLSVLAASSVSVDQYEQLPSWYRDKLQRRAEDTIARRHDEQAAPRRVS
jgi:hypothetical protein